MSVSPGSGSGTPRQWRKHQSAHFVFWFMPGSGAEKNVAALAARLENVRTVTLETLDLEVLTDEQVQVYLLDGMLDGRRPEGGRGYETGSGPALGVYLSDAPDGEAELALMELLLNSSQGVRADRAAMLVDGLLGYVTQLTDGSDPATTNAALVRLRSRGDRVALAGVLRGPTRKMKSLYRQMVTSFVTFLLGAYGKDAFKRFVRKFDPDDPDRASEAAYEKMMADLEEEWLASLNLRQTRASTPTPPRPPTPGTQGQLATAQQTPTSAPVPRSHRRRVRPGRQRPAS